VNYRRNDTNAILLGQLHGLDELPMPLFGARDSLANRAISALHSHPWAQLSYAVEGTLTVETRQRRLIALPDRAVWIPPGVEHGVSASDGTRIGSIYLAADLLPDRRCGVLRVSPLLRELIIEFGDIQINYDASGADGRLASVLIDRLAAAPCCQLDLPWPGHPGLRRICEVLSEHPGSTQRMADFGAQLGMSEKTMGRHFVAETGLTFRQWRQRSRLLASLPLLEAGMRITDVAVECGYDSLSAFIASFRELIGCTPGQYVQTRRMRRQSN